MERALQCASCPAQGEFGVDAMKGTSAPVSIADLQSEDFFRSLVPALSISDRITAEPYPLAAPARWSSSGYALLRDVVPGHRVPMLAEAIRALVARGLHPIFAYVFDEFWEPALSVQAYAQSVLGPCSLLGDGWAWLIPVGDRYGGWSAHRDCRHDVSMATLWVALTDTDIDSACMHLVPLDRDPAFTARRLDDDSATDRGIAIGARAGSALFWDARMLHWGGRSSERAHSPRISVSYTFAANAALGVDAREALDPRGSFPFRKRLGAIASMIALYDFREPLPDAITNWGRMFGRRRAADVRSRLSPDELREHVIHHCCTRRCYGRAGESALCCKVAERDCIIGPVTDSSSFLDRLAAERGRPVPSSEVFVDFDEGRALFPTRSTWQNPAHYPAMRVHVDAAKGHPCRFLSEHGECTIHAIRPAVCRNYHCEHLSTVLSML